MFINIKSSVIGNVFKHTYFAICCYSTVKCTHIIYLGMLFENANYFFMSINDLEPIFFCLFIFIDMYCSQEFIYFFPGKLLPRDKMNVNAACFIVSDM